MSARDFIVFDLETTGRNPLAHEIIEIGALRVTSDAQTILGEFNQKIVPQHIETAEPKALEINGYTPELWTHAISLPDALKLFVAFSRDGWLAGYNIAFDWLFLKHALFEYVIPLEADYHAFDIMSATVIAAKFLSPTGTWRLKDMCAYFGIPPQPEPHRALEDAKASLEVLRAIKRRD